VPVHPLAQRLIVEYMALAGHALDALGPLFRPVRNNRKRLVNRGRGWSEMVPDVWYRRNT
jgi:hypothetical protein